MKRSTFKTSKKILDVKKSSSASLQLTKKIDTNKGKYNRSFPIVAIGASAGGLEAITQLLKHLPPDTGMAFIYAQHLSPDHESILSSLLAKSTKMKVQEVKNGTLIEPNNIYVMPPDKEMNVTDGHIKLLPRPQNPKFNLLIDKFFTSLAETHKEDVIGIILSGSATDGTQGLKAIKQEGGLTIVQDDSAKFTSMPKSAIAAGIVDFILAPDKIALELVRLSQHPYIKSNDSNTAIEDEINNNSPDLKVILNLLHRATGVDFTLYKMNTIKRRILRRMVLYKIKTLKEYANLLNEKKEETDTLFHDLLITVTSFFRNASACGYLKTSLLPRLLKNKTPGEVLRIWIPACSTGEEAYSLAIILLEIQDTKFRGISIQIFATDLSAQAVTKARIASYSKQEVENVSPKRLQRFFTKSDGGYRIAQYVRDMCVFAPHNILSDPPFSHIDLISCCNLLIYFDTSAQKRVMATFHYALNPDGYLLLSKSETIGASTQLFSPLNKKYKIYLRKKNSGAGALPPQDTHYERLFTPQPGITSLEESIMMKTSKPGSADASGFTNTIDSILLSRYVPASVVVNQQMEILQFRGLTEPYLSHPSGKATLNILKMIRPDIAFELRNAISKARKTKQPVRKQSIEMNGGKNVISLEVVPLKLEGNEPLLLIVFIEQQLDENFIQSKKPINSGQNERKIKKLEEETASYRDELHTISQNHEAAIEELQSANEEVVSSNEELRSINEELETSKEEIQSASEELASTNQELQTRNELLNESYNYSEAIIATIHEPMVILDKQLRVKTANKAFYKKFSVNEDETEGMHLYDLGNKQWNIPKLREMLEDIIQKNSPFYDFEVEQTFPNIGKKIMRLNAKPILQPAHREQLISLAIYDVTEIMNKQRDEKKVLELQIDVQKKISEASKIADEYIRNVFMQAPVSIVVYKGPSFIVDLINEKGLEMWGTTYEKAIHKPLFQISPELREQGMEKILNRVYITGEPHIAHEFPAKYTRKGILHDGFFNFVLKPVHDLSGTITGIAAIGTDVTQEVIARQKIEQSEHRYYNLIHSSTSMICILKAENMIIEIANDAILETWGKGKNVIGKPILDVLPEVIEQGLGDRLHEVYTTGKPYYAYELPLYLIRNGKRELSYYTFVYQAQRNVNQEIEGVAVIATEVTPQAVYNQKINEAAKQFHFIADAMPQKVWTADSQGNRNYFNQRWLEYTGFDLEEMTGWEWKKAIHPDDWEETQKRWQQSIDTGNYFEIENRLLSKDGEYKWHLSRGEAYRDETGKIKLWVGTNTEIQKQKLQSLEFENAVQQRTNELQQVNEALQKANQEVALSQYNKRFLIEFSERFSSYKLHDEFFNSLVLYIADLTKMDYVFVGKLEQNDKNEFAIQTIAITAFAKLAENIKYPLPDGPCEQVIRGTVYSYPENCRITFPKNQTLVQFNVEGYIGYPLFDMQGNANGLMAVMHENEIKDPETVTAILKIVAKRAEVEMERIKYEEELEKNNMALNQKNEELRKMNKELEAFAYVSSHDLQEPLRKIQTFANRITETESKNLSNKGKDYFARMVNASSQMQILIEDLLAFARISMVEPKVETIDLSKIIYEIKEEFKEIIEEKNVTIEVKEICKARIIPFQFQQLMHNLISNSLKFADPSRSPHIIIESKIVKGEKLNIKTLLPQHDYCHISVIDNGIGFEQEFGEQVFEVFQRLHHKEDYPGTGIGLAIAKKIVENHNGIITATSELNKGARFDIYLPE